MAVAAAGHPLARQATAANKIRRWPPLSTVPQYQSGEADVATMEKKGVDTGFIAIPDAGEQIPVGGNHRALMEYGTGVR